VKPATAEDLIEKARRHRPRLGSGDRQCRRRSRSEGGSYRTPGL